MMTDLKRKHKITHIKNIDSQVEILVGYYKSLLNKTLIYPIGPATIVGGKECHYINTIQSTSKCGSHDGRVTQQAAL